MAEERGGQESSIGGRKTKPSMLMIITGLCKSLSYFVDLAGGEGDDTNWVKVLQ